MNVQNFPNAPAPNNASMDKPPTEGEITSAEAAIQEFSLEELKICFGNLTGQSWNEDDGWIDEDDENETGETEKYQTLPDHAYDTYDFNSLDIDRNSTQAVKQVFRHFIEKYLTIENLHHIGVGVSRQKVEFNYKETEQDYQIYLRLVRTIAENFISGFQTKLDNYVCFAGTRDEKQLELFLKMQFITAKDDLESSEDFREENAFYPIIKEVVNPLLKKLVKIYKEDNERVVRLEEDLIGNVHTIIHDAILVEMGKHWKPSNDSAVNPEAIKSRLVSESIKAFQHAMEYDEKINHRVTDAVQTLKQMLVDLPLLPNLEDVQNNEYTAPAQSEEEADKTNDKNNIVKKEASVKEETILEAEHPQSSFPNPPTYVVEEEKIRHNMQKPVPKEPEETPTVTDRGKLAQPNSQTIPAAPTCVIEEEKARLNKEKLVAEEPEQSQYVDRGDVVQPNSLTSQATSNLRSTVGLDVTSEKDIIPLPLLLHLNCRNHEVTIAALKSATSTKIRPMKMKNGETKTIGAFAQTEKFNKSYYGKEAVNMKNSTKDCHFHDIFQLLVLREKQDMPSKAGLRYFFETLKTELEEENNVRFNQVIIVVPDWLTHEDKDYLIKILYPSLFQNVTCQAESVVIAAGYFQERFKKRRQMQQPISLTNGSQPPLVMFLESFGFIHIKIVLCYKRDDDDGRNDSIIRKVALVHNEKKKRPNSDSNLIMKFIYWLENKILRKDRDRRSPDITVTKELYLEVFKMFSKMMRDENMDQWATEKRNCIVISEDSKWEQDVFKTLSKTNTVKVEDWVPKWNQLVLQGAAIYCFDGTEKFNQHLIPEIENTGRMQAAAEGKFRTVTLPHDDKRSVDVCQKSQELLKMCDEFNSFVQSNFFRGENPLFLDDVYKRIAKAQFCAQTFESINDVMAETRHIKALRESLNTIIVGNCSAKDTKL